MREYRQYCIGSAGHEGSVQNRIVVNQAIISVAILAHRKILNRAHSAISMNRRLVY